MKIKHRLTPDEVARVLRKMKSRGKNKYRNVRTEVDGILFDSKKEAAYYENLKALKANGLLVPPYFLRQVPFHLPGGVRYVCDFLVFRGNQDPQFVDVKGMKTAMYLTKKKMVEAIYKIKILEA